MIHFRIAVAALLLMGVGCVQLTPAGARVQLLESSEVSRVANCKHIASVSVSSPDALKNAAAAQGGDMALMSARDVGTAQVIKGELYNCSGTQGIAAPIIEQKPREPGSPGKIDTESQRKSALCASKGGTWTAGQCVIPVE